MLGGKFTPFTPYSGNPEIALIRATPGAPRVFAATTDRVVGATENTRTSVEVQKMSKEDEKLDARRWVNEGDGVTSYPGLTASFKHVATDAISIHHIWWWASSKTSFTYVLIIIYII